MSHASTANRRWINLQKITPDGLVIWSRRIAPRNWPTRRSEVPLNMVDSNPYVTDCCDNQHPYANAKARSSYALEVQATPDGGVLIFVTKPLQSYSQGCAAAIIKVDACGCVVWQRHYGTDHYQAGPWDGPRMTRVDSLSVKFNSFGRIAILGNSVFTTLLDENEDTGLNPYPYQPHWLERIDLTTGESINVHHVPTDAPAEFIAGYPVTAGFTTITANTIGTSSVVLSSIAGIFSEGMHYWIDENGDQTASRFVSSEIFSLGPSAYFTPAYILGASADYLVCRETGELSWRGLSVRTSSPLATINSTDVFNGVAFTGDPAIVGTTYDGNTVGVDSVEATYVAACFDPSDHVYAFAENYVTARPTRRGLQKLAIASPQLSEIWAVDWTSNSLGVSGEQINRVVADASGCYCSGLLEMDSGKVFSVWKHDTTDGHIVWGRGIQFQPISTDWGGSICLASDGNLFICGDESQF